MRRIIYVNIYNKGEVSGIKTPVYNYPLDFELYKLFFEMGFDIEEVRPNETKIVIEPVKEEEKDPDEIILEKPVNRGKVTVESALSAMTNQYNEEHKVEIKRDDRYDRYYYEDWLTKEVYTEEELKDFSRSDLIKILNHRGHFSSKSGPRDRFAPKYDDNKSALKKKIIKTNKSN